MVLQDMSAASRIKNISCSIICGVFLWMQLETYTTGAVSVTQTDSLYKHLLKEYNKNLRPLQNQSDCADIGVFVSLASMNKFDELSGELDLALVFELSWREERMFWNETEHAGIQSLFMAPESIWRPQLIVRESYDTLSDIVNVSGMLKVSSNGGVVWHVGAIVKVTCSVDVTFFPFDSQTCAVTLSAPPYSGNELFLFEISSTVDTSYMTNNSQWKYVHGIVSHQSIRKERSYLKIVFNFKRRSEFFIVYIFVPLVILGAINNLVFFMPPNTGERSSVAVTTFLAFVVYIQIVNGSVPQSSMPLAYIYYYLMFLLLYSCFVILSCIVSVYLYEREGPVSCVFKYFVIILKCRCFCCKCKRKNDRISSVDAKAECDSLQTEDDSKVENKPKVQCCKTDITWTDVAKTYDTFVFILSFLVYWVFSALVFYSLYNNSGIIEPFNLGKM